MVGRFPFFFFVHSGLTLCLACAPRYILACMTHSPFPLSRWVFLCYVHVLVRIHRYHVHIYPTWLEVFKNRFIVRGANRSERWIVKFNRCPRRSRINELIIMSCHVISYQVPLGWREIRVKFDQRSEPQSTPPHPTPGPRLVSRPIQHIAGKRRYEYIAK